MRSDDFMNAEEVAGYLHLGKNTVYQLAKSGKLASYHVGRKLKFTLEDVEAYVASIHHSQSQVAGVASAPDASEARGQGMSEAASFGQLKGDPFVIAGGDVAADLIASALNVDGMPATRLVRSSYTALVNLYAGDAHAAVVHLFDQQTNSYNVSYACSLAPGMSIVIFRLYGRKQGLIVQEGNPKNLTTWEELLRDGVRLVNRAKGSGARVLLDEMLRAMEARSEAVEGYDSQVPVASVAVRRVASGLADVAIGTSREARGAKGVKFVPLQTEWVDLVVAKSPETRPYIRRLSTLLADDRFRWGTQTLGPSDLSKMGTVVYES